jgi:hypothetical protein
MPPILQISDGRGNLRLEAPLTVIATMVHPDDPEQRAGFLKPLSASPSNHQASHCLCSHLRMGLWRVSRYASAAILIACACVGYG